MRIIAGRWRGHAIQAPPDARTRPTTDRVREAWFSMLQPVLPDARVLDLFAGSGSLGLEALSRGARFVTFVERGARAVKTLQANIRKLGAEAETTVVKADALVFIRSVQRGDHDIVLADPPYGQGFAAALAERFLEQPFADLLWLEHRVTDPLPETEDSDTRRYGDTLITRYLASDDA